MKTNRKRSIAVWALVLLAGMQLVRPETPGPQGPGDGPMSDHVATPPEVREILKKACYDCHSAETRWPWYARVAPVSWLLVQDVRRGRRDLDFSNWSTDPVREPTPVQRLRWTCEEPREDHMPPFVYRVMHPGSRLTEEEKELLCAWSVEARREMD